MNEKENKVEVAEDELDKVTGGTRPVAVLAGNDPLIVVDGIPCMQGLHELVPNEIESISILKDAASTAIYGSRGAN